MFGHMGVLTCYVYVKNQVVIDRCHGKHYDRNSTGVTNSIDEDSLDEPGLESYMPAL